ncbi:MAG: DUF3524 domain-containing protein [Deltaproteobacteria bacterium]|nr:DUF3524 domain-containing protein [Deltaproteobacteria bacterium]
MSAAEALWVQQAGAAGPRLLFLDPYLTHSHRAFLAGVLQYVPARWTALSLAGRHFRWRMRGAAAFLALAAGEILAGPWDGLVCTSMLALAELRGLVPALAQVPAVAVFHENQLAYPAPGAAGAGQQERDLYLAFQNLTTALAARRVVFNSAYQRDEVLAAAATLLARLPDARPPGLVEQVQAKSQVLPIPLDPAEAGDLVRGPRRGPLRLVWNHRWEHDKDPAALWEALFGLARSGRDFQVAVLGPRPPRVDPGFAQAAHELGPRLVHLGWAGDRREYWRWLFWADVGLSTARQEYFGLALAEAVWAGCRPLAPATLVYPELYPAELLYPPGALAAALEPLLAQPELARRADYRPLAAGWTWPAQAAAWREALTDFSAD